MSGHGLEFGVKIMDIKFEEVVVLQLINVTEINAHITRLKLTRMFKIRLDLWSVNFPYQVRYRECTECLGVMLEF